MLRGLARSFASAVAVAAVAGGSAAPTAASSSPPGTNPPPAAPAKATVKLSLPDAFFVKHHAVTVPGRVVHVVGKVRPFVPNEWVTVKAFVGRRLIKRERLRINRSPNGTYGRFTATIKSRRVGVVTVYVGHPRSTALSSFLAHRSFATLDERVGFGSTGRFVQLIQRRLAELHFYIPQSGVYDQGTGLAIDAYHRLLRWGTYQTLDRATVSWLLDGYGAFKVHDPRDGNHAEGNLSIQLLALIKGSRVYRIYPISSGKPSTPTVLGHFHVYSKVPGYLPDGMYFSSFFYGGYAIHGYDPAPDYPASHGCMRLPIVDAISAFGWLRMGAAVDVYY